MSPLDLERVLDRANKLPSPPGLVADLLASLVDEHANLDDLAQRIGRDQAIAAKVLRLANSAFFGLQGRVASLVQASVVLGQRNLRSLAIGAGVIAPFSGIKGAAYDLSQFWRHSVGVGACARALAGRVGENAEFAFTAGLLHDIGRLVLVAGFPQEYGEVLRVRAATDVFLIDAERGILGLDHAVVGAALARRWKFPEPIQAAVAEHHEPGEQAARLSSLVHCADVLAIALDFGNVAEALVPPLSAAAWNRLELDWNEMPALLSEIDQLYAGASELLAA
ncbi:MAG: HDOD domain-containing protein [Betaproteobacteria bacterium]|nr:HDOD domain-containing protein [Betaproteobacteria bacterium]